MLTNKWVERLVPLPRTFASLLVVAMLFCLVASVRFDSGTAWLGFGVGILVIVGWVLFERDLSDDERERGAEWDYRYTVFFCTPGVIIWLVFVCTFVASPENSKVWIVNKRTAINHSVVWGMPFFADIQSVQTELDGDINYVTAKTSDGVNLRVHISIDMKLVADELLLLRTARNHSDATHVFRSELYEFLSDKLTIIIKGSTLEELQDRFSENREWITSEEGQAIILASQAEWSGNSNVTDLELVLD